MGIYYGDIHYGVKISKKVLVDDDTFLEPFFELIFDDETATINDYLSRVANIYSNLSDPDNYRYELLVDVITIYNGVHISKGWQPATTEEIKNFVGGIYKIDFVGLEKLIQ